MATTQLTLDDKKYIKENYSKVPISEIAKKVCKPETTVISHIYREVIKQKKEDLSKLPDWIQLRKEFNVEELRFFQYRYDELNEQFKGDVTPTEKIQVFHLIKFEILMNRHMAERKECEAEIIRIEQFVSDIYKKYGTLAKMSKEQVVLVTDMEKQIAAMKNAKFTKSKEYVDLMEQHRSLMRDLKSTRSQRIEKGADTQHGFLNLMRTFQDQERRDREARQLELVKKAVEQERTKLSEYHKYIDGQLDRPILNSKTIMLDQNEKDAENKETQILPQTENIGETPT